ncbi:MAG: OmpA family protein [Methylobacter sp.]|nr:OmpA family protein [Methylobacter sp.]
MKSKKRMNHVLVIAVLAIGYGLLTGCATAPNRDLDEARSEVAKVRSDPAVTAKAPVALYDAEKALKQAENSWSNDEDEKEVSHLSYLAKRKAEIAKYTADRNMAEDQLTAMKEDSQKALLKSKTEKVQSLEDELMKMKEYNPQKTNRGLVLTLGDVLFATGKAELNSGSQNNLYQLTTFLRENPDRNILIEGYTDSVGSEDMNLRLSLRRADSVAGFLAANGIERGRIVTKGYGEAYPKDSNDTVTGRQYNRRVELIVLDPGKTADDVRRNIQ